MCRQGGPADLIVSLPDKVCQMSSGRFSQGTKWACKRCSALSRYCISGGSSPFPLSSLHPANTALPPWVFGLCSRPLHFRHMVESMQLHEGVTCLSSASSAPWHTCARRSGLPPCRISRGLDLQGTVKELNRTLTLTPTPCSPLATVSGTGELTFLGPGPRNDADPPLTSDELAH